MKTAGIDSCKAGWLLISFDNGDGEYRVLRKDSELRSAFDEFDRIFHDLPIGLNEEKQIRTCDEKLRERLGPEYAEQVIIPPIRPALDAPTYVEANTRIFEITGENFSLQAWNSTPKIRLVDGYLREHPELKEKILESHPELLFMNLNGGGMIYQRKNTKKGLKHRLDLIRQHEPAVLEMFRNIKEVYRRNEVSEAVITDAIALAWACRLSVKKGVKRFPDPPEIDSKGFKMAIHYV